MNRYYRISRRKFLASAAAMTVGGAVEGHEHFRTRPPRPTRDGRKPVALIATVYRPLSHTFHIAGRFLHGYAKDGAHHVPAHYLHSMHIDQAPGNDLSKDICREHRILRARSVREALLDEQGQLAVEGVLLIGEHGNYPRNDRGQVLYPRHDFMKQIVEVFRETGESVPVFNDKHLSHAWSQAKEMVAWSRELDFPLMAGSSLPLTWRRPELDLKKESPVEEALVAAYGPIEVFGFDGLEALQAMMERREGGETGVKGVTCLSGKEVWKAGDQGRWSWELLEAALGRSESVMPGDIRKNVGAWPVDKMPKLPPIAFLVEYLDGTRGTVLLLNGHLQDFCFAARIRGEEKPASCMFHMPPPPGAKYFDALVGRIEMLLEERRSPTPIERTLLTTGILDRAMESHQYRGSRLEAPELEIRYSAPEDGGFARGGVSAPL